MPEDYQKEQEFEELKKTVDELQDENEKLEAELAELKVRYNKMEQFKLEVFKEKEQLQTELAESNKLLAEYFKCHTKLQAKLSEAENSMQELVELRDKNWILLGGNACLICTGNNMEIYQDRLKCKDCNNEQPTYRTLLEQNEQLKTDNKEARVHDMKQLLVENERYREQNKSLRLLIKDYETVDVREIQDVLIKEFESKGENDVQE